MKNMVAMTASPKLAASGDVVAVTMAVVPALVYATGDKASKCSVHKTSSSRGSNLRPFKQETKIIPQRQHHLSIVRADGSDKLIKHRQDYSQNFILKYIYNIHKIKPYW